jgi:hypothetical protein
MLLVGPWLAMLVLLLSHVLFACASSGQVARDEKDNMHQ